MAILASLLANTQAAGAKTTGRLGWVSSSVDASIARRRGQWCFGNVSERFWPRVAWPVTRFGTGHATPPDGQETVQAEPLSVKAAGLGLAPVWVPLKPKLVDAPGASVPL